MIGEKGSQDTKGVSPVIGVILMVAITVILAALIGSFVLGVGDDIEETPRAGVEVVQDSDSIRLTVINSGNLDSAQIVGPQGGKSMRFEDTFGVGARILITEQEFNNTVANVTPLPSGSDARSELTSETSFNDLVGDENCLIRHSAEVVRTVRINGSDIGCSGELLEQIADDDGNPAGSIDEPDFAGSEIAFQSDAEYQFIGIKESQSTVIRRIRSGDF